MSAQTSSFGVRLVALVTAFAFLLLLAPHRAHAQSNFGTGFATGITTALLAQNISKLLASPGFGMAADAMCTPVIVGKCTCKTIPDGKGGCKPGPNKYLCPPAPDICSDTTAGSLTIGTCVLPNKCKGVSTSFGGSSMGIGGSSGLNPIVGALLGGLLQKLMSPSPPTTPPFGGGATGGVTPPGLPTCSIYSSVIGSTASSTTVNLSWSSSNATSASLSPGIGPVELQGTRQTTITTATNFMLMVTGSAGTNSCSTQVFSTNSSLLPTSNNLSELLNSLNNPPVSENLNTNTQNTQIPVLPVQPLLPGIQNPVTEVFTTPLTIGLNPDVQNPFNQVNLVPGAYGDIKILGGGATIIGGSRTGTGEIAGFYGTDSYSGEGGGLVERLCLSRPWAGNFLSNIIPPTFFDSLCKWRGFATGEERQVEIRYVRAPSQTGEPAPTATSSAPVVEPQVWIKASPESVSLGGRTSIFWSTQGVTACTVSSSDGNFEQQVILDKIEGASTIPLTEQTTFTIACTKPDGSAISDYVTVKIGG